MSLRSDAWVVVVSQERGETSVACAGELWDVGSSFPEDRNYQVQEDKRRSILMGLGLLWESRQVHSTASGRVHSLREPWVWDGTARDQQSGLEKKSKHHKGKMVPRRLLRWSFERPCNYKESFGTLTSHGRNEPQILAAVH